jgi:uncharacterized protein YqeY
VHLEERISQELAEAMRQGDDVTKRTLRLVRAALQNAAIAAGAPLGDDTVLAVLQKQAKQRREAIAEFERGGRPELAEAERHELGVIERYLPRPPSEAEIEAAAQRRIAAVGASGAGDIGRVMGPLMQELGAAADGRAVQAVVRRLLAG